MFIGSHLIFCVQCPERWLESDGSADVSTYVAGEWIIAYVNTTSLNSLKARLMVNDAHVSLAQGTGLTKVAMHDFGARARNRGWATSLACVAYVVPCDGGQTSAGDMVIVRTMVGLCGVQSDLLLDSVNGRLVDGKVQVPGFPHMAFGRVDLQTGR